MSEGTDDRQVAFVSGAMLLPLWSGILVAAAGKYAAEGGNMRNALEAEIARRIEAGELDPDGMTPGAMADQFWQFLEYGDRQRKLGQ